MTGGWKSRNLGSVVFLLLINSVVLGKFVYLCSSSVKWGSWQSYRFLWVNTLSSSWHVVSAQYILATYYIIKGCNIPKELQFLHIKVLQTLKEMGIIHSNTCHREDQTVFLEVICLLLHPNICTVLGAWFVEWMNKRVINWFILITFLLMFSCRPEYPRERCLL